MGMLQPHIQVPAHALKVVEVHLLGWSRCSTKHNNHIVVKKVNQMSIDTQQN